MNRDQLKAALTEMGVEFANNAPTEKLQALYDEALARKSGGDSSAPDAPEGNSGSGQGAAPAGTPDSAPAAKTFTEMVSGPPQTEAPGDEIPEEEIRAKVAAGLSRHQAIEVITNQRAHDKQLAGES